MTRRNDTLAGAAAARSAYVANHAAESRAAIHCNQFDKKIEQLPFPQRSHYSCTETASNGAGPHTGAHTHADPRSARACYLRKNAVAPPENNVGVFVLWCHAVLNMYVHVCSSRETVVFLATPRTGQTIVVVGVRSSSQCSPETW